MGLFGRKSKKKNKVSFGADVSGGTDLSDLHNTTMGDKIEEAPPNNNSTSSSSSSGKPQIQRGEDGAQHQKITSSDEILLPFREPKAPTSSRSLSSDINESNHQINENIDDSDENSSNGYNDEAEFIQDSEDSDEIDEMDEMTADPNEDSFDYFTPQINKQKQDNENENDKKATIGMTMMPPIPDLDNSKSARNDHSTPQMTSLANQLEQKHDNKAKIETTVIPPIPDLDNSKSARNNYLTPQVTNLANQQEQNHNNKASTGTSVMPPIPDLDNSKSARKADRCDTPNGTNSSALVIGSNDSHSNSHGKSHSNSLGNSHSNSYSNSHSNSRSKSNSNSTKKAQFKTISAAVIALPSDKNNHDTNQSNQSSGRSTSSESVGAAKEHQQLQQRQQQQEQMQQQQQQQRLLQQQYHQQQVQQRQQNQPQYYPQQQLPHEIESEQTRDLVKVFIGEIWNRGEIESIQKVCSPRLRFNGHTGLERVGHDGFSRMVTTVRSSLEGYHCEIHSMVVEGRKCFCRLKFTGKHVGMLMGYPPTYKLVAWMGASEFTICPRKKQILKVWELGDIKTLEAQLMS